ncbi:MAG TPA: hypothetical protein VF993_13975, partial [Myxococcales bacterium]
MSDLVLETRARRAYELGRLRWSLRVAPFILVASAAVVACGRPLGDSGAICLSLLLLAAGLGFAGGSAGRAVVPGLAAGTVALVLPLLVRTLGHVCFGPACMPYCLPASVLGGAVAGALIARQAAGHDRQLPFLLAALALAGLTGALGCTLAGTAGVLG